jgi:hypothetical protein
MAAPELSNCTPLASANKIGDVWLPTEAASNRFHAVAGRLSHEMPAWWLPGCRYNASDGYSTAREEFWEQWQCLDRFSVPAATWASLSFWY